MAWTRCPLGLCDGSGFLVDEATNTASDCRCRPARIARRRARRLEASIPRRYRDDSFERLVGSASWSSFPEQVRDGAPVRGERRPRTSTRAAACGSWATSAPARRRWRCSISKAALDAGRTVAIYSLPRLLNLIREAIEDVDGVVGFLDRLAAVDLLHIDDVGAENRTDWALEQLYSIVNTRYEDRALDHAHDEPACPTSSPSRSARARSRG